MPNPPQNESHLRVLILAPSLDGGDVGEVYSAFQWVEALSHQCQLTVLATSRDSQPLAEQLPNAEVITWPEPTILYRQFARFNSVAKPWMPIFMRKAARWIKGEQAKGRVFDIAHQIVPQAMRYPSSLRHLNIPYIIGPLGGGLNTPPAFAADVGKEGLLTRLRSLDNLRLRYDPTLRASYENASMIFGVAPYIHDNLTSVGLGNIPFKAVLERGHGILPKLPERQKQKGKLRVLHVGRTTRTKALRDVIRAMAHLRDLPDIHLISAGNGPDMVLCRKEADDLGISERITFLGHIPRKMVDLEYEAADIFCFPSFREPMGGVFFEAMEYGLPIIAAAYGGPDFIVDNTSGIRLPVVNTTYDAFSRSIAETIRNLAINPEKRLQLGCGARRRIINFGSWEKKATDTITLYHQALEQHK